jgi:hypothetical protein
MSTDNSLGTKLKDPDESKVFSINWQPYLGSATIVSSSWVVDPWDLTVALSETALTTSAPGVNGAITNVTLVGGARRGVYHVTNRVQTSTPETLDLSFFIHVTDL